MAVSAAAAGGCLAAEVAGLVLMAPMCVIGAAMRPPAWQVALLEWAAWAFPAAPVAPVPNVQHLAFSDPAALARAQADPTTYHGRLRLGTGLALCVPRPPRVGQSGAPAPSLKQPIASVWGRAYRHGATQQIEAALGTVRVPFLVVHSRDDKVTDPAGSARLHAEAPSADKTLLLYDRLAHVLLEVVY